MPARKTSKIPSTVYTPKTELDTQAHLMVEAQLKRLKLTSRLLHEQLSSIGAEARILERLYYKSKNQHRSAAFWAKASEIRRYTSRVVDVGFAEVVDSLRLSFYGEASLRNSRVLKGSWTHYPGPRTILHLAERLAAGVLLVDKYEHRLINAGKWFTIAMESMYFMDLLLAFGAITSRLLVLARNVRLSLGGGSQVCEILLSALHLPQVLQLSTTDLRSTDSDDAAQDIHVLGSAKPKAVTNSINHVDVDTSLLLASPTLSTVQPPNTLPRNLAHSMDETDGVIVVDSSMLRSMISPETPILDSTSKPDLNNTNKPHNKVSTRKSDNYKRKGRSGKAPERDKSKKVKKRDAIDDIFGF